MAAQFSVLSLRDEIIIQSKGCNFLFNIKFNIMRSTILLAMLFASCLLHAANTDSAAVYNKKGLEEKQLGHSLQAFEAFDKAYNFDNDNKQTLANLADALFALRRYPQAKEKYALLVKMGGEQKVTTYKQLTDLSFNLKQYNDVILYAGLLKKTAPDELVSFFIGKAQYSLENYGEAMKYLELAAKENPKDGEVPYMMARINVDMENLKRALPLYEKAIVLSPDNIAWIFETGMAFYENDDAKSSLKYLLLAGEKGYPKNNQYLQNLAVAYTQSGDLVKGIEVFEQLLSKRPQDVSLLKMIARTYYEAKKYKEAISYWDRVLELNTDDFKTLYMTGVCYQKKGDEQLGNAICNKAIKNDPSLAKYRQEQKVPEM